MSVLVPCPGCARHVRASESTCPFCAAELPTDLASRAVPAATRRMSRGAVFTFAASVVVGGAVACGGTIEQGGGQTMYGSPNIEDGGASDAGNAAHYGLPNVDGGESDGGGIGPMYGIANIDSGDEDASVNDGGSAPLYGMPPPPPEPR